MEVSLVHELCPMCASHMNEQLLIPKQLNNKKLDTELKEANGQAIGFSNTPCDECKKHLDEDYVLLVSIDPDKTKESTLTGTYRTGKNAWIRRKVFPEIFARNFPEDVPYPMIFVDDGIIETLKQIPVKQQGE